MADTLTRQFAPINPKFDYAADAAGFGYAQAGGGQTAASKDLSLSASLNQQAEYLAKAEDALRSALSRLRGARPEGVSTAGFNSGPASLPTINDRASANARMAAIVCSLAGTLAEALAD